MLDSSVIRSTFINANIIDILYACLLSFTLGVAIALTYVRSFTGLSYSRTFLQALIFAPLLTAIAMQAIGDSVARGLGLMGAFSLLRFRTNIKDSRDMMFMFAALAAGLACGVSAYSIAIVSLTFFCIVVFIVHKVPFSTESDFDAVLRMQVDNNPDYQRNVDQILGRYSRRFSLISMREMNQGERLDLSYQVKMNEPENHGRIVGELGQVSTLRDVQLFMQDRSYEV